MANALLLQRARIVGAGAFGMLSWAGSDAGGPPFCLTLERTYGDGPRGTQVVKIAPGVYGLERTWFNRGAYNTWQVIGGDITAERRVLIHKGNWETDSDGCVLVGSGLLVTPGRFGLSQSSEAFSRLMSETAGIDRLELVVVNCV